MKVVVISASPRKIGKTQTIMKYVAEYILDNDAGISPLEVKFINLSEGGIDYYTGDGNLVILLNRQSRILLKPMSGFLERQFITHFLAQH